MAMSSLLDIFQQISIIRNMQSKEEVSNTVQELRKEYGATQEQFAEAVGVTRQTVISIEKGNYIPSVLLAMKIAKYFNKSVEQIFRIDKIR